MLIPFSIAPGEVFQPVKLKDVIHTYVSMTLLHFQGNKTLAALALGIDRRTLYRMLQRHPHLSAQP